MDIEEHSQVIVGTWCRHCRRSSVPSMPWLMTIDDEVEDGGPCEDYEAIRDRHESFLKLIKQPSGASVEWAVICPVCGRLYTQDPRLIVIPEPEDLSCQTLLLAG